jgi:hypothetical protein
MAIKGIQPWCDIESAETSRHVMIYLLFSRPDGPVIVPFCKRDRQIARYFDQLLAFSGNPLIDATGCDRFQDEIPRNRLPILWRELAGRVPYALDHLSLLRFPFHHPATAIA